MARSSIAIYDAPSLHFKQESMTSHRIVFLSLLALIQGCGGGGGGGGGGGADTPTVPGAFSANVRFEDATQRFVATWNASSRASRYRILLRRDESVDFSPLNGAENLSAATLDFSFAVGFTIQWSAAALRVEACNEVGCVAAADLPLLPHLADALASKQVLDMPADADDPQVAVSADGNILVVGAPLEGGVDGLELGRGAVYVFTRTGTTWNTQPTVLRAPNGEGSSGGFVLGDRFGEAVALSADGATLVVGAPREDGSRTSTVESENNEAEDAGAVYIFVRNAGTYELQAYLKPTPAVLDTAIRGDQFGSAVALAADGQTVVVGSSLAESGIRPITFNDGSAYVFTRAADTWTQRALLEGLNTASSELDRFGRNVSISSDGAIVAVAAPFDDGDASSTPQNPNANALVSGAVYVFATTDRLQWPRQAYLKAPNAEAEDVYGIDVALSADGNTLAVGALGEDGDAASTLDGENDNLESAGAVYVYTRSDSGWSATPAYLKPSSSVAAAEFGGSLSLTAQGNQLAVSAPFDVRSPPLAGAVYVFVRVGDVWREQVRFEGSEAQFGNTVAITPDGASLFVAAEQSNEPPTTGTVHVY
jgi:hypothetical protein